LYINRRPGSGLIRLKGTQQLYAILIGNKREAITDEAAKTLYGKDYIYGDNYKIRDLNSYSFYNYTDTGATISGSNPKPHPGMVIYESNWYYVNEDNTVSKIPENAWLNLGIKQEYVKKYSTNNYILENYVKQSKLRDEINSSENSIKDVTQTGKQILGQILDNGWNTETCQADSWDCGSWSACSSAGSQIRTCTKTNDCPNVDTASPATSQSCTSPITCAADTWSCGNWGTCSQSGEQNRTCSKTNDCPNVDTASPATTQSCTPPIKEFTSKANFSYPTFPISNCNKEIAITDNLMNKDMDLDYCTHLKMSNGVRIYFDYNNNTPVTYQVINYNGVDYLYRHDFITNFGPNSYISYLDSLSQGLQIGFKSYDSSKITVSLKKTNDCLTDKKYCDLFANFQQYYNRTENDFDYVKNDIFEYYFDKNLISDSSLYNTYKSKMQTKDKESYDFLVTKLGFEPPTNALTSFSIYTPGAGGFSIANGFKIENLWGYQPGQSVVNNLQYGNTHEFVHTFFAGAPVKRSWFEEGLADYMEHAQKSSNLNCSSAGWNDGINTVAYSDFNFSPQAGASFYTPQSNSAYYKSAECFWVYIRETYGEKAITEIAKAWHNTRRYLPITKDYWLIKDVVNPVLGTDLSSLVKQRYNYTEQ